jgi:hypothetical protein
MIATALGGEAGHCATATTIPQLRICESFFLLFSPIENLLNGANHAPSSANDENSSCVPNFCLL